MIAPLPLTTLYNESLREGIIASAWKQSNITPIHKGGCTDDPSNYRLAISVVPVVAKVFEKIVSTQLHSYLVVINSSSPGCFLTWKFTEDILLVALGYIVNSLDFGQSVCGAFLDLRRAYDSLDQCILLCRD